MTKKILSVFALGLLVGVILTSFTHGIQPVDAARRRPSPTPTPIPVVTPTPAPVQNKVAGFYQNLTGANLNGAFLAYHDFSGFTLTNASIRDANLTAANFNDANLDGVDFTNSNLSKMTFTGTSMVGVKWYNCPDGDGMCGETVCPDGMTKLTLRDSVCF